MSLNANRQGIKKQSANRRQYARRQLTDLAVNNGRKQGDRTQLKDTESLDSEKEENIGPLQAK
jgi:hypothetical protein